MKIKNRLLWRAKNAVDSLFSKPVTGSVRHAIRRVVRPVRTELDDLAKTQEDIIKAVTGGKNQVARDTPEMDRYVKEWEEVLEKEIELSLDGVELSVTEEMELTPLHEDLLLEIGVLKEETKKKK